MRPERVSELANYPCIRQFVLSHLAMQFGDVRAMLRLPTGCGEARIENGCNFAAAATICNLIGIGGISVVLFNRNGRLPGRRQPPKDRKQRFKDFLSANYYPWRSDEDRGAKINALYDLARNPFAHALGILEPEEIPFSCEKTGEGLTQSEVDELDVAYDGQTLPLALEMNRNSWHLNVPYFYAATVEMFRSLTCDQQQMRKTEECFLRGELTD